ncbi:hypothetical protein ACRALDRAFT_2019873 [Sodiomyces alcalophilus JCM 7366]|uniref:uncharacterized protein n=1 Tax=Sodiomyces alcalophilus JCM 7366 TaxID=591952 RepID=UPI0039B5585E
MIGGSPHSLLDTSTQATKLDFIITFGLLNCQELQMRIGLGIFVILDTCIVLVRFVPWS